MASDRRAWARNHWLLCAAGPRRGIRHDQRHLEREPRAQTLDHCDDRKCDCPRDLVGIGDLRRVAGTHVDVERSVGGAFAIGTNHLFSGANLSPGAFALVAMGAVFGAASRATFSFIIFAFEITRDYNSVLPLMLVAVIADGIAMLFMPRSSIMTEKLARRGLRVHQDYEADVLTQVTVAETMEKDAPVIAVGTKVGELAERIARHDPAVARSEALLNQDD